MHSALGGRHVADPVHLSHRPSDSRNRRRRGPRHSLLARTRLPVLRRLLARPCRRAAGAAGAAVAVCAAAAGCAPGAGGRPDEDLGGGEASLALPDLSAARVGGVDGRVLLAVGVVICLVGLGFGLVTFLQMRRLPAHRSMLEVAELIYSTCQAYLVRQGRFLLILWVFITAVIVLYYKALVGFGWGRVGIVIAFSLLGMAGSYLVAWFGIRVNTFANARTAYAALPGMPYPVHRIPLRSGMSIGMVLISLELLMMLIILLLVPAQVAGACFIGFAIGESLGASALRIAGGIFTKIADIGADLMKIVFKIDEDDPRNPGVIADCTGDNAGDSVGPSADGFETYGVTGVALVTFVLLAVDDPGLQATLLVWLFSVRAAMIVAAWAAYALNSAWTRHRYARAERMNFEMPLSTLVWLTSVLCIALTYLTTWVVLGAYGPGLWLRLATIVTCGTAAGALIPELVKVFTSTRSRHVRETVKSSRQGGASLNILSGVVAGNFSAYWLGMTVVGLMTAAYLLGSHGLAQHMLAPSVFSFGLVAFGFLGTGPVTIAVDSYGPVTDNAQSVYELSRIERIDGIDDALRAETGIEPRWERAKLLLEDNDGAGNTFKATAKPVLIGTAVVGATTMIFSIIIGLTDHLTTGIDRLSLLHAPFLLGLVTGGAVVFWFSGASIQAVTTGANRAVSFIRGSIHLDSDAERASVEDSRRVVEICTQYAQQGMLTIFLAVFFATLAFAFAEPYFFIGYLVSIAVFGLYQAIYMANAGGAWDNAKKVVEVDLHMKGTALHDASVVGDTVGDPFKDTSSVALNPIIKFTTLFGLLAVELAVSLTEQGAGRLVTGLSVVFLLLSVFFVHRSFYAMRTTGAAGEELDSGEDEGPEPDEGHEAPPRGQDLRARSTEHVAGSGARRERARA
ncbi:Putative K(+)-stimulated pyrophosphate-energized sodium pump [Actinomyces howellii]|uniref:K(+)-insensitive pyrophosphate-energized proton pump n=2 Tax=Actinomyces howellii TaxID=52771 RepID=A0A3S4SPK7_9ACTO|nr:Putative K(+)-stimulated pyrophosphate-energized sodium pump [Actinomyces howellii]